MNAAIKDYLAERPGAEIVLQALLDRADALKGEMPSARGVKTSLLFTDIAGSSALFDQYGDRYGRHIVAIHDRIVESVISAQGGVQIKCTGDGALVSFASCGRSVKAAIQIQRRIAKHVERFPLLRLRVRIGVNIGVVIKGPGDLYGSSVNLAARLRDVADPDGILTTGIVRERCKNKGYEFSSRGNLALKGFGKEIPIYQVVWRRP